MYCLLWKAINRCVSSSAWQTCDVLQGSMLGPVLFCLYVHQFKGIHCHCFAARPSYTFFSTWMSSRLLIRDQTSENFLQLNPDRRVLIIGVLVHYGSWTNGLKKPRSFLWPTYELWVPHKGFYIVISCFNFLFFLQCLHGTVHCTWRMLFNWLSFHGCIIRQANTFPSFFHCHYLFSVSVYSHTGQVLSLTYIFCVFCVSVVRQLCPCKIVNSLSVAVKKQQQELQPWANVTSATGRNPVSLSICTT